MHFRNLFVSILMSGRGLKGAVERTAFQRTRVRFWIAHFRGSKVGGELGVPACCNGQSRLFLCSVQVSPPCMMHPRGPRHTETICEINLLSVVSLLHVVIHYWKCSESLHSVLNYHLLSSESLCVVTPLRSSKMGSQHPSPNVKTFCNFEPQI